MIEALEGPRDGPFLVGLQWHPEMLIDGHAGTRRLFEEFIAEACRFREAQVPAFS